MRPQDSRRKGDAMRRMKVNRLETRKRYTLEEFFDAIKEARFTAGKPRLTHEGFSQLIVFPAVDVDNQVRICNAAIVSPSNKFYVRRDGQVGAIAGDELFGSLVGGWDDRVGRFSLENAELCERLAEKTCRELEQMDL